MSCSHPILINNRLCACGRCLSCRNKKVNDWATRCQVERLDYSNGDCFFCTLTYNNENLPKGALLDKSDLQKFFKRLRRHIEYYKLGLKIKYFACGEYGDQFGRPHYHFIIYGLNWRNIWLVQRCWNKGFIKVDFANFKTFRYVAKYSVKQFQKCKYGVSEFIVLSKGLGFSYVTTSSFKNDLNNNFILIDGFKRCLPYSFKRKARELGIFKDFKEITIFYNEKNFEDLKDFKENCYGFFKEYFRKDFEKQEIVFNYSTFKEYFHDLENSIKKEKEKFFLNNVYNDFYLKKYDNTKKRFYFVNGDFKRDEKFDLINRVLFFNDFICDKKTLSIDSAFGFFKDKIYSNYNYIFY